MSVADVEKELRRPDLQNQWQTIVSQADISDAARAHLLSWIYSERDMSLRQLQDVDSDEGLGLLLPLKYIEFKSNWIMANTQLQFCLYRGMEPDPETAARASLISLLQSCLDAFISEEDREQIDRFLFQPLGGGSQDEVRVESSRIVIENARRIIIKKRKSNDS